MLLANTMACRGPTLFRCRRSVFITELETITKRVLTGGRIEDELGKMDWKGFEKIIGDVFAQNGFSVRSNFRFRTKRRYENDIIAVRGGLVFCVDCKRWSSGREKRWGLTKAALEQEKRAVELKKFFRSNIIAREAMRIPNEKFVPLIVTLHQESVLRVGCTFVVPVRKLNSFVLESENIL